VPLDSWVYPALERLEAYGLIDSALWGTKPYARLEVGRLVQEAMTKWEDRISQRKTAGFAEKELIPSLLERFKREFKPELIEWGAIEGTRNPTFLKPVDEIISRYVYQTDNPVIRPQTFPPSEPKVPQTHTIYPIYNNDGIVYQKHNNFSSEIEGEGRLWDHFSLYYQPIFKAFEGQNAQVDLEKGYVKAEALNIELEAGRDSMWWGPGYNGALLISNNAKPFDMVKLSNPQPILFPWIFKYLGLFKFNLFMSRLDYENPSPYIDKPLLHGIRIDLKPHRLVEFGLSYLTIFDGEGRQSLGLSDYFKIIYGSNTYPGTKLDSNKQISVDLAIRIPNIDRFLPLAKAAKLYVEYGAEESNTGGNYGLPEQRASIWGIYLSDLFLLGRTDLRIEYANTAAGKAYFWYVHGNTPPIYHDRIFGNHVGNNGEDIFIRLTNYLSPRLLLGLDFNLEKNGIKSTEQLAATQTKSYQWGADLDYLLRNQMSIKGRYILESFRDPSSIAGGDSIHHLFLLEFRKRF